MTSIRKSASGTGVERIEIINQLLLPHTEEWIEIDTVEKAWDAIRSMKIRGAPAIASLAALSVSHHVARALESGAEWLSSPAAVRDQVQPLLDYLWTARPTAVNLGAATSRLSAVLNHGVEKSGGHGGEQEARELAQEVIREGIAIDEEDVGRNREMGKHGATWLIEQVESAGSSGEGLNVMTVCNTGSLATSGYGTALGLITRLYETGKLNRAYFTQSTPYHQGSRLTALELKTLGIPSTMVCDSMVGSLFQHHRIDGIAVGADRIAANGDTANKIGTYNAAVLAKRHGIPFIVVAPVSTVDLATSDGSKIPIEQRPPIEACVVRGAVFDSKTGKKVGEEQASVMITPELPPDGVYNPSFDVTPAELITAIVTEKGVATRAEGATSFDLSSIV
ncbi:eukaryotic translation initiation factor 2B [Punctularia strigosozonata HHB-11173 SS5]|uniref:eukaryotic translation initiation factor 2B n=1 Tax=Punctularia strigosozonata (strain HHB-11173) TaxID=741275 RepID=UPI0004418047|nr:eukaryotic translation initiation factor 2B [Punctularia strigosozonata HHB-11173 SS5]EIN11878.1 eukaryotic translation initiation factor 2B [Punctularia strigosozonata HHB-11173 SS5]